MLANPLQELSRENTALRVALLQAHEERDYLQSALQGQQLGMAADVERRPSTDFVFLTQTRRTSSMVSAPTLATLPSDAERDTDDGGSVR